MKDYLNKRREAIKAKIQQKRQYEEEYKQITAYREQLGRKIIEIDALYGAIDEDALSAELEQVEGLINNMKAENKNK